MSAIETVGALIGIADVSFRSISALYSAVQDIRNAPKEVLQIAAEIDTCLETIQQLSLLEDADESWYITKKFGLAAAISLCGEACDTVHKLLVGPLASPSPTLCARIRFYFKRKELRTALASLQSARQTTILSVVVTHLVIQQKSQLPFCEESILECAWEEEMNNMFHTSKGSRSNHKRPVVDPSEASQSLVPVSSASGTSAPAADCDRTGYGREQERPTHAHRMASSMFSSLKKKITQHFKGEIDAGGKGHKIGLVLQADSNTEASQTFDRKVSTKEGSEDIRIGIYEQ